ncbi:uncharacterized protein BDBG_07883 [Neofusicoccum parvum]|uniref:Uncharacterized protein BDBG_07883 n=1 Tax=Neofusicoccum parvum TaxID=310453 RepID=A0ACB5S1V3_9PEZI|nr:uncharacterized protein BDBG_07883 [Neofusicoccum parvum]
MKDSREFYNHVSTREAIIDFEEELTDDLTIQEAQALAATHSKTIFEVRLLIKMVLDHHEDTIRKRWAKKASTKRREVLKAVCDDLPADHCWNIYAATMLLGLPVAEKEYLYGYLWPHLNVEDLIKGDNLPLLLNTRGRTPVCAFVYEDMSSWYAAFEKPLVKIPNHLDGYMILHNQLSLEFYGKVVPIDREKDGPENPQFVLADVLRKTGKYVHIGFGLAVLHVQEFTYRMLLAFCYQILPEMDDKTLIKGSPEGYIVNAEPPQIKPKIPSGEWPSLSAKLALAPYTGQEGADFDFAESLIQAECSKCEDFIWFLREDPEFFDMAIRTRYNTRQQTSHTNVTEIRQSWASILWSVVHDAYFIFVWWDCALKQFRKARAMHQEVADDMAKNPNCLPTDYETELRVFLMGMDNIKIFHLAGLSELCRNDALLRKVFNFHDMSKNPFMVKREYLHNKFANVLEALISPSTCKMFGIEATVHELDRLFLKDSGKNCMTPELQEHLGQLALSSEVTRQVFLHQPRLHRNNMPKDCRSISKKDSIRRVSRMCRQTLLLTNTPPNSELVILCSTGMPDKDRFLYPVDQPRTPEIIKAMITAEQNLDEFWQTADKLFLNLSKQLEAMEGKPPAEHKPEKCAAAAAAGGGLHTLLKEHLKKPRELRRTAEDGSVAVSAFAALTLDGRRRRRKRFPPASGTEEPWRVPPRALRVVRALFYEPHPHEAAPDVMWKDFVFLMASMGFSVLRLGGGAWLFWARKEKVAREMLFQEPWEAEKEKMSPLVLREIVRRLEYHLGWRKEYFAAKK